MYFETEEKAKHLFYLTKPFCGACMGPRNEIATLLFASLDRGVLCRMFTCGVRRRAHFKKVVFGQPVWKAPG